MAEQLTSNEIFGNGYSRTREIIVVDATVEQEGIIFCQDPGSPARGIALKIKPALESPTPKEFVRTLLIANIGPQNVTVSIDTVARNSINGQATVTVPPGVTAYFFSEPGLPLSMIAYALGGVL